jgi:glycerol-3-phosphate acyltransferase PlsY
VGHSFSCYTGFRGGKGVATASGGLLVLMPIVIAISAVLWWGVFSFSRYVSLASILAALMLPFSAYFLGKPPILIGLGAAIALFVALRHRANVVRLLNGTENKFVKKDSNKDSCKDE